MLLAIILAGLLCVAAGIPVLPVLVVGGIAMAVLSYGLTGEKRCLNLGIGLAIIGASHYMVPKLLRHGDTASVFPEWLVELLLSDALLATVAVTVILVTGIIGLFGPLRGVPLDIDGVLKVLREREEKNKPD